MFKTSVVFALLAIGSCLAAQCSSPEVESKSFTTQDATIVAHIGYISEFSVKCASGSVSNLYAELNGNVIPVSIVGPNVFQVSWTEELKVAKSGDHIIRLFDEIGYTALRKAIRAEEDIATVPSLFNVVLNHPGAYNGPKFKSELVASLISFVVAYFAIANRAKVLA